MEEWVEVTARTVDEAVTAGLKELGLDSPESAEIEVLQQPQRGFLGFGGQDAHLAAAGGLRLGRDGRHFLAEKSIHEGGLARS